jgi:hypothetical protein
MDSPESRAAEIFPLLCAGAGEFSAVPAELIPAEVNRKPDLNFRPFGYEAPEISIHFSQARSAGLT